MQSTHFVLMLCTHVGLYFILLARQVPTLFLACVGGGLIITSTTLQLDLPGFPQWNPALVSTASSGEQLSLRVVRVGQ